MIVIVILEDRDIIVKKFAQTRPRNLGCNNKREQQDERNSSQGTNELFAASPFN